MMTHENGTSIAKENGNSIAADFVPPDRSSSASAPPVLELATESLFAFNPTAQYANIFADIRAHEDYYDYYHQNAHNKKLPPPLEPSPFLFQDEDLLGDFDARRAPLFNHFSGHSQAQEALMMEARQKLQEMQLENSGIPTGEENPDVWSPIARRKLRASSSFDEGNREVDRKQELQTEINFSSSPSAQTAFRSAQFIWKDEEGSAPVPNNFAQPFSTHPVAHSNGLLANALENSLAQNSYFGQTSRARSTSPRSPSPPSTEEGELDGSRSNIPCRYYAGGYCSRGDKCFYSHDVESLEKAKNDAKTNRTPTKGKGFKNGKAANPVSPRHQQPPSPVAAGTALQTEQIYTNFDQLIGKIYLVSRDQQGCRFLQKKLEEKDPQAVEIIFNEVFDHITDLMTDPFGNYLCQKLLEFCNDEQRLAIVEKVSSQLVNISKNMHGTRAVQKMIECLSAPSQIQIIIRVLSNSVVELIQDLNGNHVIQRCLNRLSSKDNQFIYDAVTSLDNCVQVATHRHGCCVLQRCIDHASERQKVQLIEEITKNALTLVQDPYGNYVVQYVLELPFPNLVHHLAAGFVGHIRQLATQKFSSNVIEKCLSLAAPTTRTLMIKEILTGDTLAIMLQDPYANYVVQTALTVSESQQHLELVEAIRPHLTQLRNTPYGKRIQSKIAKETAERQGNKKR